MSIFLRHLPLVNYWRRWELTSRLGLVSSLALPPLSDVIIAWVDLIKRAN